MTKGLEYFVRSRWGEDGGGPWTFVLKVTSSLKLDLTGEFEFVLVLSARLLKTSGSAVRGSETLGSAPWGGRGTLTLALATTVYLADSG